ncbi:MAG: PfkB family carbohydrate kinase [Blautia producta]|uniref:PfkB family carbohydrate kinase n=1 Tax=Blautia producta TaxID=33035 RepID=UPI00290A1A51|nr:PfkB family carbohydrate kinase [Blautia producta]MDU5383969.1 PfkB family carbohydrate kinase [Blautia producta]
MFCQYLCFSKAWRQGDCPAVPRIRCVDTTGAGDSFAAGFVYALSQDMDLRTAAAYANVCGGLAVQKLGATEGINNIVQVENAVKKYHSP